MDYFRIYDSLIEGRRANPLFPCEYGEFHHVVPRCAGGGDDALNIVQLSAREHYVAHLLLWKMNPGVKGLTFAVHSMSNGWSRDKKNKIDRRKFTGRLYENLRRENALALSKQLGKEVEVFGVKYPSITKMAKAHGTIRSRVAKRVSGGMSYEEAIVDIKYQRKKQRRREIVAFGETYPSVAKAALAHNIPKTLLLRKLQLMNPEEAINHIKKRRGSRAKEITAFGVRYPSIAAAARAHNMNPSSISIRLSRKGETPEQAIHAIKQDKRRKKT